MSHLPGRIGNPILTDDSVSSTSDFSLGELNELEPPSSTSWWGSAFAGWPVHVGENVTAFEDADLLGPAIPDERGVRESKTFCLTLSSRKRLGGSFTYLVVTAPAAPYIPPEEAFGPSPHHSRFSPDFYSIKRFVVYVMRRPGTSLLQQPRAWKTVQDIPVAIHPQVVRQAEEKTLTDDLEAGINLAQDSYSTLKKIEVNIEHDPEIAERKTIRFTLVVSGEPDTVLEDEAVFKKRLRRSISPRARELITVTYSWEKQ